ncbi:MAG: DUF624 domain-containing protein [Clostridiales bacterium]|nr:DUF624 domain-containing protein [Clostridiales bacterium]
MFEKMMNNFYYGKSGKGDFRKEDLPQNRWQLFWDMLRVRLSGLFRLNLMTVLVWLPVIIVIASLIGDAINATVSSIEYSNYLADGTVTESFTQEMADTLNASIEKSRLEQPELAEVSNKDILALSQRQYLLERLNRALLLLIPCILITGPVQAGVAHITRNWSRDEHAFIWSDFKDAVKANWKQGLGISAITGFVPMILWTCWQFYGSMAAQSVIFVVPQMLTLTLGLVWLLACTFFYPLMVSYKMNFKTLVKNGMLLTIARLPHTVGIRLAALLPAALFLLVALMGSGNVMIYALLFLGGYYILIGFTMSRFIFASFTNGVFDKYINSRIEGAKVNRGMAEAEDDDEEEEEEEIAKQDDSLQI